MSNIINKDGVVGPELTVKGPLDKDLEKKLKKQIEEKTLEEDSKKALEDAKKKEEERKIEAKKEAEEKSASVQKNNLYLTGNAPDHKSSTISEEVQQKVYEDLKDKNIKKETKKNIKKQANANAEALFGYIMENKLPLNKEKLMEKAKEDPKLRGLLEETLKSAKAKGDDSFSTAKLIEELRVQAEGDKTEAEKAKEATEEGRDPSKSVTTEQIYKRYKEAKENTEEVSAEEKYIENSNEAVANAKVGDKLKRDNGEVVTITQEDIDAAKKVVDNKVPEPEVKVPTQEEVVEAKKTHLENIEEKIAAAEAAVATATGDEKVRLESQLKDLREARDFFKSAENFTMEDAEQMYKDMDYLESDVYKHELPKGLIGSWIRDSKKAKAGTEKQEKAYKEMIDLYKQDKKDLKDAEKALKKAQKEGDPEAIEKAQEWLNICKEEMKVAEEKYEEAKAGLEKIDSLDDEVNEGYGWFLINALGTALSNMYIPGQYGKPQGTAKSAWQQRMESNIARETERWNQAKDKKFENTRNVLETKFGKESAIMDSYNKLLENGATQRMLNRLSEEKILQSAYIADKLGKILPGLSSEAIFRGSLYGAEGDWAPLLKSASVVDEDEMAQVADVLENAGAEKPASWLRKTIATLRGE